LKYNKGVSPEKLIETLWYTKETKDAINNRSVNIAKLKSILEKIEDCTLQKEFGYWKLIFNRDKLYIDLDHFLQLFAERTLDNKSINELIGIVQRGPFLPQTSYQWADSFKSEISSLTIDALVKYCQYLSLPDNAERVITICNAIFAFDELNENALQLKCKSLVSLGRHTLAKEAFEKFASKYKEIYADEYETNYAKMIS
jgi:two-component SAPR family response regulator